MSVLRSRNSEPGFRPMLNVLSAPLPHSTMSTQGSITTATVYSAQAGVDQFNNTAYITKFNGTFYAMWSSGAIQEDVDGQRVRYATSSDGTTWSASGYMTPLPASGFRYTPGGFWQRNGVLYGLAGRDEAGDYWGNSLETRLFTFSGSAWSDAGQLFDEYFPDGNPPVQISDGTWLVVCMNIDREPVVLRGDLSSWSEIPLTVPGGMIFIEPTLCVVHDRLIVCRLRDNSAVCSERIWWCFSTDRGLTWSTPKSTNFPDATAKHAIQSLGDGRYVFISNSHENSRLYLTMAVSDDGLTFDRMKLLRSAASAPPQWSAPNKNPGFNYPNTTVQDGNLYVVYSLTKEDILVSVVPISAIT